MANVSQVSQGSNVHSSNVVAIHYKVGEKIGEGLFGVVFDGQNLLDGRQVAIKFVTYPSWRKRDCGLTVRNPEKVTTLRYEMNTEVTKFYLGVVCLHFYTLPAN